MLTSGDSYSIKEIFSGNNKIVVPDMQREYCWAYTLSEQNNKSLVENFISDITQNLNDEELQMGLLYGYESPKDDIQLCDGQQRLTTLYLLIGILRRKINEGELKNVLQNILISDFELEDDREPRLQYAIRESTLFFLRDLVYYYFLKKENSIQDGRNAIIKEFWYFDEYNLDPSIKNILKAIDIVEGLLKEVELETLANRVISRIHFLYFDMMNRNHGEEQFVVLNTTGKPLTTTENLKPKFLGSLDNNSILSEKEGKTEQKYYSDLWEEWEHFFFVNKHKEHQTADNGLNDFFRWIFIIENTQINQPISSSKENYNEAQVALSSNIYNLYDNENNTKLLDKIHSYFKAIESLSDNDFLMRRFFFQKSPLSQIQCLEFLPVLCFAEHYKNKIGDRNLIRIIHFFKSKALIENISKASITTAIECISIVKLMILNNYQDLVDIINHTHEISKSILNPVEIFKLNILKSNPSNRIDWEKLFWKTETYKSCSGDIEFLFSAINISVNSNEFNLDINSFEKAALIVELTLEKPTDLMRRAMLCFGNYFGWHGSTPSLEATRYTFGNDAAFYGRVIRDLNYPHRVNTIVSLLEHLSSLDINDSIDLELVLNKIIVDKTFENEEKSVLDLAFEKLIKEKELWDYMSDKLFAHSYDKTKVFILRQQKVTGSNTYRQLI
jgi:uncharacterized protein with ParB-like and HNH nuclease domain